jgi:hypothetical protein
MMTSKTLKKYFNSGAGIKKFQSLFIGWQCTAGNNWFT